MNKTIAVTIFVVCAFIWSSEAEANKKWCLNNGHLIIHWMNGTTTSKARKKGVINTLNNYLRQSYHNFGTRLSIIQHNPDNISLEFSACMPGCPPKSYMGKLPEQLFGLGCQPVAAKRNMKPIKSKINNLVGTLINVAPNDDINIFNELIRAAKFHEKTKRKQKVKVLLLSSMDPLLGKPGRQKSYDSAFVKLVQSIKSAPQSLNNISVHCIGGNLEIAEFWRDVFEAYSVKPSLNCS